MAVIFHREIVMRAASFRREWDWGANIGGRKGKVPLPEGASKIPDPRGLWLVIWMVLYGTT